MKHIVKRLILKVFQVFGYDVTRISRKPEHTLLGLSTAPFRTILDVGANTGQFAGWALPVFPKAQIYCFEPLPGPFSELTEWANRFGNGRVQAYNVALGSAAGTIEMHEHLDHSPSSSLLRSTELNTELYPITERKCTTEVRLETLDDFLDDTSLPLEDPILIKLDVQGYEDRVIGGGQKTFRRALACILEVNLDYLYEQQADFRKIVEILDDLEYRFAGVTKQRYGSDGHVIFLDAVFLNRVEAASAPEKRLTGEWVSFD